MIDKREYIRVVAKYGGLQRAAEELYISPSALSKSISKLEESLDVKLFNRIDKKMTLTYAGERYLFWADQISQTEHEMQCEINGISRVETGRIRFGIQLGGLEQLLHTLLPAFNAKYGNYCLELFEMTNKRVFKAMSKGAIDIGIYTSFYKNTEFKTVDLKRCNRVLMTRKGEFGPNDTVDKPGFPYPWIDYTKIANMTFIAPFKDEDGHLYFSSVMNEMGFYPKFIIRSENFSTMIDCVANGLGVALTTDQFVDIETVRDRIDVYSFGSKNESFDLVLTYRKGYHLDAAAEYLIACCQEYFAHDVNA